MYRDIGLLKYFIYIIPKHSINIAFSIVCSLYQVGKYPVYTTPSSKFDSSSIEYCRWSLEILEYACHFLFIRPKPREDF